MIIGVCQCNNKNKKIIIKHVVHNIFFNYSIPILNSLLYLNAISVKNFQMHFYFLKDSSCTIILAEPIVSLLLVSEIISLTMPTFGAYHE